jgi:hypothetical protein
MQSQLDINMWNFENLRKYTGNKKNNPCNDAKPMAYAVITTK